MIESKQRVRIIGPPGALTHRLTELISEHAHLPAVHLSEMKDESELQRVLRSEKWIVSGSFAYEWAEATVDDATLIIYLNTPRITCWLRVLFRGTKKERQVLWRYRRFMNDWKQRHARALPRIVEYETVDEAYKYFVEASRPDLFM